MAPFTDPANFGAFVPTTNVWDPREIYEVDITSMAFKELLVRLYQNLNNISINLNLKDTGYYVQEEFVNSQQFFENPTVVSTKPQDAVFRQVFRKVIDFGALPNTGVKTVAHNIAPTSSYSFTRIYGTASDQTGLNYIPLPYAGANPIELSVDATNVIVTTTSNRTNFNVTYIVLEYLKS